MDDSPLQEFPADVDETLERRNDHSEIPPSSPLVQYDDTPSKRRHRDEDSEGPTSESQTSAMTRARRADLAHTPAHHRTVQIPMDGDDNTTKLYLWGTRICVRDVQTSFRLFLQTWRTDKVDDDENDIALPSNDRRQIDLEQPYYMERLMEIDESEHLYLNINLQHVNNFDNSLYRKIVCYPSDVIPYLDMTVNEVFLERFNKQLPGPIEVRPFNAEKTRNMRGLNPEDIDQLITITGMVTRTSPLIPEMRQGYFECSKCKNWAESEVDRGRIEEPTVCSNCQSSHCFQLIHNRSLFMDKQIIKLQEAPDDMPSGQTPHAVTLYAHGSVVETVQAGDRLAVTGIYRAQTLRPNPRMRTVKAVYKTSVDVLHFRRKDQQRLHQQDDAGNSGAFLPDERIQQILELSRKPDIANRLAHALAPSIYEHDDVKKGILCMLFGGTRKDIDDSSNRGRLRSELNVLLCGDPGTSKSQLLQHVYNMTPRSQYTSGKSSSAVGLTAAVSRDPDTKHFVLQTGALVMADNGVCCIDEFDKMSDSTRSVLHEVMEQQTLSIAKAGIICQLNARTSILAAANPVDSQWNSKKTIIDNLQLPHTLLSRFDLIFLLVDPQCELYDRRLATHLVSLYHKSTHDEDSELLDLSLLRDYISYAKTNIHPQLSEEASQCLIDKYLSMRQIGTGKGRVTAYPRQLESLIRLAEASAKIRLADTVLASDVEDAYRLHCDALKQAATDPATGLVDVNILAAGMSSTDRKAVEELGRVVTLKLKDKPGMAFPVRRLLYELRDNSDKNISRELFDDAINDLVSKDIIVRIGDKVRFLSDNNA